MSPARHVTCSTCKLVILPYLIINDYIARADHYHCWSSNYVVLANLVARRPSLCRYHAVFLAQAAFYNMRALHCYRHAFQQGKWGPRGPYGISIDKDASAMQTLLDQQNDHTFQNRLQMSEQACFQIARLAAGGRQSICLDSGNGRRPCPACEQVALFLLHVGAPQTKLGTSLSAAVSEGLVYTYIRNVTTALLRHQQMAIQWPNEA